MGTVEIGPATATERGVRMLAEEHLTFARAHTAPALVFALGADALGDDRSVSLFAARRDGRVLAIGAIRALDPQHGELKSMRTTAPVRGSGLGRELLRHLLSVAQWRGYARLSLETGTGGAFAPARGLYASEGFEACGPFGAYTSGLQSCFMTRLLQRVQAPRRGVGQR